MSKYTNLSFTINGRLSENFQKLGQATFLPSVNVDTSVSALDCSSSNPFDFDANVEADTWCERNKWNQSIPSKHERWCERKSTDLCLTMEIATMEKTLAAEEPIAQKWHSLQSTDPRYLQNNRKIGVKYRLSPLPLPPSILALPYLLWSMLWGFFTRFFPKSHNVSWKSDNMTI